MLTSCVRDETSERLPRVEIRVPGGVQDRFWLEMVPAAKRESVGKGDAIGENNGGAGGNGKDDLGGESPKKSNANGARVAT